MPVSTSEHRRRVRAQFGVTSPARRIGGSGRGARKVADRTERDSGADAVWQGRAYHLSDAVGELGYVTHLTANTAKDAALRVGSARPDLVVPDALLTRADEMLSWFVDRDGAQDELVRLAVYQLAVGGETILVGDAEPEGVDEAITWEFVATTELILRRNRAPQRIIDGQRVDLSPDTYLQRCHRIRPSNSQYADSGVRRLLPIAEEIHLLDRIIANSVRGRLNAGGLYLPDELSFGAEDDEDGGLDEEGEELDDFDDDLIRHITTPIEDYDDLAAQIPMIFRGPGEFHDKIRHFDLGPNAADWAVPMRQDALSRLIRSMDAPPEVVEGKGGLNHWTGASVDHDYIEKYVKPLGQLVARFITVNYLRPMLIAGGVSADVAMTVAAQFDVTPLTQRADDAAAARLLHPMGLVSDEVVARSSGFTADHMPDDAELYRRKVYDLVNRAPVFYGPLLLPTLPEFADVEFPEPRTDGQETGDAPAPSGDDAPTQSEPDQAQPAEPEPDQGDDGAGEATTAVRVTAWADMALERSFERAEARLRSVAQGRDELRDALADAGRGHALAAMAGRWTELDVDRTDLLAGSFDALGERVTVVCGRDVAAKVVSLMTAWAAANMGNDDVEAPASLLARLVA